MSLRAAQQIDLTGEVSDLTAAAAGGDTFAPGDNVYLEVANAHATLPRTVTIDSVRLSDFGTDVNPEVVVAALTRVKIGPFPADRFRAAADGLVHVSYSDAAADLTIGVFSV